MSEFFFFFYTINPKVYTVLSFYFWLSAIFFELTIWTTFSRKKKCGELL